MPDQPSICLKPDSSSTQDLRLGSLLKHALALTEPARQEFLDGLTGQAKELREDLAKLLQSTDPLTQSAELDSNTRMPDPNLTQLAQSQVADLGARANWLGRRVGPFILSRLIGAGGMGTVYEGQRVEGGFRQIVAIKLVSGAHPGLLERFAVERQILADLRHPNIAQLLDGGQSSDGVPYFAMEYIDGRSLTEHVEATGADLDTRLALLVEVAEALEYAHGRKLIHRDIKPNNILVGSDGHVKLLDFGIAKLLDEQLPLTQVPSALSESGDSATRFDPQLGPMTPEYAAPEQFSGAPLSVATDCYQFGVLLFRTISGRSPYQSESGDGAAFARAVCELAPLVLSDLLKRDSTDPRVNSKVTTGHRLDRQRLADLDQIAAKCLAKRPEQRYHSMQTLIADLRAVQKFGLPSTRPWLGSRVAQAGAAVFGLVAFGLLWLLAFPGQWPMRDAWRTEPALYALGLNRSHLHTSQPMSETQIRQALLREGQGDLPGALALLESIHSADPRTPVPALLLSYWGSAMTDAKRQQTWRNAANQRLSAVADPTLSLLAQFFASDLAENTDDTLRYSAALLELHPEAWFLHLARAHVLNRRGLAEASLRELQAIKTESLGHRKLVDAIADRASFGDLKGARAMVEKLEGPVDSPEHAMLEARLAYTAGELTAARDFFALAVSRSQALARLDIESRALLYLGVVEATLLHPKPATVALLAAKNRLAARAQKNYAIDAALCLAQLAAMAGEPETVEREILDARELLAQLDPDARDPRIELFAARLTGVPPKPSAQTEESLKSVFQARTHKLRGDTAKARTALQLAKRLGIEQTSWLEEYALLARELGLAEPILAPLDPPFGPYTRFAGRWALGAHAGVVPLASHH